MAQSYLSSTAVLLLASFEGSLAFQDSMQCEALWVNNSDYCEAKKNEEMYYVGDVNLNIPITCTNYSNQQKYIEDTAKARCSDAEDKCYSLNDACEKWRSSKWPHYPANLCEYVNENVPWLKPVFHQVACLEEKNTNPDLYWHTYYFAQNEPNGEHLVDEWNLPSGAVKIYPQFDSEAHYMDGLEMNETYVGDDLVGGDGAPQGHMSGSTNAGYGQ